LVTDVELCGFSDVVGRPYEVSSTKRWHQVNSDLKVELHCPVVVDVVMVHLEWCHRPGKLDQYELVVPLENFTFSLNRTQH